jgi:signal transduction histidine kinase
MTTGLLDQAFVTFAEASKSLERSYATLQGRIEHLTEELSRKNEALGAALAEVERHRNYLETVLQSLEEAIVVVDAAGKITVANRAAAELFGFHSASVAGKKFSDFPFSIMRQGSDIVLTVGDRRSYIMISRAPVADDRGNPSGEVILIRDVTRLRELEAQHERNQRLISMGEMAAKIVHEVRNPLCSMELFANLLARDLGGTPHQDLAQGISAGISNLNTILTNMLLFAKPRRPALKRIELAPVVAESLQLFIPLMETRGVALEQSLREGAISGDPGLIKQVLANIIVNAVQAVNGHGRVTVTMREEGEFLVVDVRDNGAGIEPEDREKIFDPFFSTKESGTGLGLAIASKVIQAHGGYIKVWSEAGRGSIFSLYFPAAGEAR